MDGGWVVVRKLSPWFGLLPGIAGRYGDTMGVCCRIVRSSICVSIEGVSGPFWNDSFV